MSTVLRGRGDGDIISQPDQIERAGLRQQLAVFQTYHNFCLPHASLRLPIPEAELITEPGVTKRWRQQTPAMAAGLTDRVWSLRDVLMYRVPPWPQSQVG